MSVKAGVSDTLIAVREKLRGKIGQTKVVRYWPGKAPDWARDIEEDDDDGRGTGEGGLAEAFPRHEDPGLFEKDDRRLRRVAESRVDDREEVRADHRRIRQAEIISTMEEEEEERRRAEGEEEEEAGVEERRRAIRERRLQVEREEVAALRREEEEESEEEAEEEEEGSEYETDSEEEAGGGARMVKPVFVAKAERETIAERERAEEEERAAEEAEGRRREERRAETKRLVVEEARRAEEEGRRRSPEAGAAEVETDDEAAEAEEYEAWKGREIGRVRREREEREAAAREREETERVRGMTEEERREWERRNPKPSPAAAAGPKQKWRFMQKYYHKGAFFQSSPDDPSATAPTHPIYSRDFSAATGEDKMDRTILPKVMQVKHFGRSGRTKWTHLVNEDTTDWNSPWIYNDPLRAKYNAKMAGMNAPIGRPKGSKKIKDWEGK